ncbi:helix-turn-helix transcriptional regulator [Nocardia tengchongensis]|uniref:helix-turn-helix domain-containing protein n=1 Tax=Nocardia tengchongensis TaxID=2055889 RepID=UPI0033E109AD
MQDEDSVGRRIAKYRKLRGMTQVQLAAAAGVGKQTLAKVESGHAAASPIWVGYIANTLGVESALLYGEDAELPKLDGIIPTVRRVLAATDLLPDLDPEPLDRLKPQVLQMMAWRHAAAYAKMAKLLPDLVDQLLVATQRDGAEAYTLLTYAYRAANTLSHKLGHNDLSMLATDRMIWAATQSDDPLLLATTRYVKSAALARIGASTQAIQLTDRTIADVEPFATDLSGAAVLCALHMRRAGLAATGWDNDATDTHYAEAARLATDVGDREILGTVVGPTNLQLWELNSAVDLGRIGIADKIAQTVSLPADFPRERQAHFWLDRARAALVAGKPDKAVDALQEARLCAPEYFRHSRAVKTAIKTTAEQQRRASSGLRALATYAGVQD